MSGSMARLTDRGVVALGGSDAGGFLQNLVTVDVSHLGEGEAAFAGLLSPQGKILFDFIVSKRGDTFLLDVPLALAADLIKRLSLYRLRAAVTLSDLSSSECVFACWNGQAAGNGVADPRSAALGCRLITANPADAPAAEADYHALRIEAGIPEGGRDYDYGDTYPHEALYDRLKGVSFSKGCYVGQEIVSRMEHRATVKKRVVPVSGSGLLSPARPEIMMGDVPIGRLGSVSGNKGLALIRVDRVAEAATRNIHLTASGQTLSVTLPSWAAPAAHAPESGTLT